MALKIRGKQAFGFTAKYYTQFISQPDAGMNHLLTRETGTSGGMV